MKSFLSILLLFLISCNNKSGEYKFSRPDTIKTLAPYIDFSKKEITSGAIFLIAKDSFIFAQTDTVTFRKQWVRDTTFFLPTLVNDTTHKDSLGNFKKQLMYMPTIKAAVAIGFNLDSNIAYLTRFMKANPQIFSDTTKFKK